MNSIVLENGGVVGRSFTFGSLRFLLAYLAVVSHLVGSDYFAHFGFYAVRGFFVISWFLMTSDLMTFIALMGPDFGQTVCYGCCHCIFLFVR